MPKGIGIRSSRSVAARPPGPIRRSGGTGWGPVPSEADRNAPGSAGPAAIDEGAGRRSAGLLDAHLLHPGLGHGGLGFGDPSAALEDDGEGGEAERVFGFEFGDPEGALDGLVGQAEVGAESGEEPVREGVVRVDLDGFPEFGDGCVLVSGVSEVNGLVV